MKRKHRTPSAPKLLGSESKEKSSRTLALEVLEPRVLFSGSPAPAEPAPEPEPAAQEAPAAESSTEATPADPEAQVAAPPEASDGAAAPAAEGDGTTALVLTDEEIAAVADAAVHRWTETGLTAEQEQALANINYVVADLEGTRLGSADQNTIYIDIDAAGQGWFVDSTPLEDSEFSFSGNTSDFALATSGGGAAGKIDLLTTILHEQGHILGLPEVDSSGLLMSEVLGLGERKLPGAGQAVGSAPGSLAGVHDLMLMDEVETFETGETSGATTFSEAGADFTLSGVLTVSDTGGPFGAGGSQWVAESTFGTAVSGILGAVTIDSGSFVVNSVNVGVSANTGNTLDTTASIQFNGSLFGGGTASETISVTSTSGSYQNVVFSAALAGQSLTALEFQIISGANYLAFDDLDFDADIPDPPVVTVTDYAGAVLADNPLGFWQFNEGIGTATADSSGNANDGVFTSANTPNWVGGRTGRAGDSSVDFSQGGGYVNITTGATGFDSVATTNQVTVEFWGYGDLDQQPRNNTTFNLGQGGNRAAFVHLPWGNRQVYWDAGGSGAGCCGGGTRINTTIAATEYEGKWNHYAFVKDANTGFSGIYINGNLIHSSNSSSDSFVNPDFLRIAENHDGMIDDVAIYDQALTVEQIHAHIAAAEPSAADDSGYTTDDNTVLTVSATGDRENLALSGTATQSSTRGGTNPNTASGGNEALFAIDGNTNGNFNSGSVTHTNGGNFQWWQVELAQDSLIDEIVLFNRSDCCGNRLSQMRVSVFEGDPNGAGVEVFAYNIPGQVDQGGSFSIDVGALQPGVTGDFIRVAIDPASAAGEAGMGGDGANAGGTVLSLAEVQVFGSVATGDGLLANDITAANESPTISVQGAVVGANGTTVTTDLGGQVTVNPDGSFTYDPTTSNTLNSLEVGDSLTDTFTYTLSDSNPYRNLALGGIASQSTTRGGTVANNQSGGNVASVAIDGNTDGQWGSNSTTHTNGDNFPWWQVELEDASVINEISVFSRADCCGNRNSELRISVWDGNPEDSRSVLVSQQNLPTIAQGGNVTVDFGGIVGDFVRIQIDPDGDGRNAGGNTLSLAEVQIFGTTALAPKVNVALAGTATQSTTRAAGGAAERANDGNTNGQFGGNSVTHTSGADNFPWWQVELTEAVPVDEVVLFNRADCCGNRLNEVRVSVYNGDPNAGGTVVSSIDVASVAQGGNLTLDFGGVVGNFVRVQIDPDGDGRNAGGNILSLAEVQVFSSSPFPAAAAPLALWLDASDIDADGTPDTFTDGSDVKIWADKSGNGRNASLGAGDPNYVASSVEGSGRPAVSFDGNDQLVTNYNFDNLGADYTIITVARYAGTQGVGGDYERLISSDNHNWLFGYWGNSTESFYAEGWVHLDPTNPRPAAATGDNAIHIHSGIVGPSVSGNAADPGADFFKDGVQLADNATGSNNTNYKPGQLSLGAWTNGGQEASVGEVSEVLIFDGALSSVERKMVESYLEAKYSGNDQATVSIQVNGANDAPTARDDAGTTDEDTILTSDNSAMTNLLHLDALDTGEYAVTADGQTFDAHVENVDGTGWLLVGRGRAGWDFDTDGPGGSVDVVNDGLGTTAAFTPTAYSDTIINDLIAASGLDLTDVEIRLKRAADPNGLTYQEGRWGDFQTTNWTWDFDSSLPASWSVEASALPGGSAYSDPTSNTRDTFENPPNNNDARRVFTWAWGGNDNQQGFNYGSSVSNGTNDDSFLFENQGQNHATPYTEVYIRAKNGTQIENPGVLFNDTDVDLKSIEVINPSFEDPGNGPGGFGGTIPGWADGDGTGTQAGTFNPTTSRYPLGLSDGDDVAFSNGPAISQIVSDTLTAGKTYVLQVDVGNRNDTGFPGFDVQLRAGGAVLAGADETTVSVPDGGFATATVTFSVPAGHAQLGQPLEIYLGTAGGQTNFDNVRLYAQDTLTVVDFDATSANGATVNVAADGSYTYDPTSSATIQALGVGETLDDTFTYTVSDGTPAPPANGRFIKVENNGGVARFLHLGEIEVFAPGVAPVGGFDGANDLALSSKGATVEAASNTSPNGHGNSAATIDGAEQTGGSTWTSSNTLTDGFIIIDLGASFDIDRVRLHQRNDGCCQERLSDVTVTVLADDGNGNPGDVVQTAVFAGQATTNGFAELAIDPVTADATVTVTVTGKNDAPDAVDDSYTATEGSTLTVDGSINLLQLDELTTGEYAVTADGQTFDAHVENVDGTGWLLVGRGREGWQFDADGPGGDVHAVNDGLGTSAAFTPTAYSDTIINELLADAGLSLTDVEIRLERAADPVGTTYQQDLWRPTTQSTWTWDFDDVNYAIEHELLAAGTFDGNVALSGSVNSHTAGTRDDLDGNDFRRVFTWAWGGHANVQGFSFGSGATNGVNNDTSFHWENANENHAIPYTEVYIRAKNGTQEPAPLLTNDTDIDTNDLLTVSDFENPSDLGAQVNVDTDGSFTYTPEAVDQIGFDGTNAGVGAVGGNFRGVPPVDALEKTPHSQNAITFDGTGDFLLPVNPSETDYTFSAWFRTTANNVQIAEITNSGSFGQNDRNVWIDAAGNINARVWSVETITGTVVNDGQWHHVTHTFGGDVGGQKLYIDGVEVASGVKAQSDFGDAFPSNTLLIGAGNFAGRFVGDIGGVELFDSASSAERAAFAAKGSFDGIAEGMSATDTFTYTVSDVTGYQDTVLALNPLAYYTMNASEITGSSVANLGSAPNDASLRDGAAFTANGILGGGLSINDNSNQRLEVDSGSLNIGSEWTVSAWFNDLHDTSSWRTLTRGPGGGGHHVIVESGQNDLGIYSGGFVDSGADLLPGDTAWHHIAAVGNGTANTTDFYIDGVFVGQAARASVSDIEWIGNHSVGQPFAQTIDEFAVFGRGLTASEIGLLATTPSEAELGTKVGAFSGSNPGEGLDLQGDFLYAVNARGPAVGAIGDAVFTDEAGATGVTISAVNQILNWQNPNFDGGDNSENALETVMQSIRWTPQPGSVTVNADVTAGTAYKMQLLFFEPNNPNRGFDISAEGQLIVDNFTAGVGSNQGAVVTHTFVATDNQLNVILNGVNTAFGDKNPILQGFTLEEVGATDTATVTVTVNGINDAPVLVSAIDFTPVAVDDSMNPGQAVSELVGNFITDVDMGAVEGIAITGAISDSTAGTFEYSTDGGSVWTAVGTVANNSALLLRDTDLVRYRPDETGAAMGSLTFKAWDQTNMTAGLSGTKVDTTIFPADSSPYSVDTATSNAVIANLIIVDGLLTFGEGLNRHDIVTISTDGATMTIHDDAGPIVSGIAGAVQVDANTVEIGLGLFEDFVFRANNFDDTITIGNMGGFDGSLTIDGEEGFDSVTFAAGTNLALGTGIENGPGDENLDVDAETVKIDFDAALSVIGDGTIDIAATGGGAEDFIGIQLKRASLTSADGAITLVGEGGSVGNHNDGVQINVGSTITTAGGSVSISGTGTGTSGPNDGVSLVGGSDVTVGGAGTITIEGTSSGAGDSNGVLLFSKTEVTTAGGDISVAGVSAGTGARNSGIYTNGATVAAGGAGSISLDGEGGGTGSHGKGLRLTASSFVASGPGDITLAGTGGPGTRSNVGVEVGVRTSLATGSGDVTVTGEGGGTASQNTGVAFLSGSSVDSGGGITVAGTGGDGTSNNDGVSLISATLEAAGDISVTGEGAGGGNYNRGIDSTRSSIGGAGVTLTGTGTQSGGTSARFGDGVYLNRGGASASGTLTIVATGGTGSSNNRGFYASGVTLGGTLAVTGTADAGTTGRGNSGVYILNSVLGAGTVEGTAGGGTGSFGAHMNNITGGLAPGDVTGNATDAEDELVGNFFNVLPALVLAAGAERRRKRSLLSDLISRLQKSEAGESELEIFHAAGGVVELEPKVARVELLDDLGISVPKGPEGTRTVLLLTGEEGDPLAGTFAYVDSEGTLVSTEPVESVGDLNCAGLLLALSENDQSIWSAPVRGGNTVASRGFSEVFGL